MGVIMDHSKAMRGLHDRLALVRVPTYINEVIVFSALGSHVLQPSSAPLRLWEVASCASSVSLSWCLA